MKKGYRGFGFLSFFNDPLDLAKWSHRELQFYCNFATFNRIVDTEIIYHNQKWPKYVKRRLENESKPIIIF